VEEGRGKEISWRKGEDPTGGPHLSVRGERGGEKELGRRANWAAGRELGSARLAGPVRKEEGGWAGGLKGRGEGLRVLGSFFQNLFKL
jgi:hypothetical protein